jgi:hypothetical protein
MKPLSEKNFAENVLKHGAGGLNIDASRVGTDEKISYGRTKEKAPAPNCYGKYEKRIGAEQNSKGRFPSNVILDEEAGGMLNGEARFFYCSKASSSERNAGMRWDSERGHRYPTRQLSGRRKELNATACERVQKSPRNCKAS